MLVTGNVSNRRANFVSYCFICDIKTITAK